MIADLMLFARPPQLRPENVNLAALLSRITHELRSDGDAANVCIAVHVPPQPVQVSADSVQLAVAIPRYLARMRYKR